MALSTLPLESEAQTITDWFEFKILCTEYGSASIFELERTWDVRRNAEDVDFENSDSKEAPFIQKICNEISYRLELLGDSYPFVLSSTGESLEISKQMTEGGFIYLFCLFISHLNKGEIFDGTYLPNVTNNVRDLFQACATLAAAAKVAGHAYSFGFPRPDKSGFLVKLQNIYSKFGEGNVVPSIPRGAARSVKDDQIDIIAWQDRSDKAAGKIYVLGQVASGNNWPNKSIKGGPIDKFHGTWFGNPQISSQAMAALFMPFCILPEGNDSAIDRVNVLTFEFGSIIYRHLLPKMAQEGAALARARPDLVIERLSDIPKIIEWVTVQVNLLRNAA
jgi:hypothetical protein